MLIITVENYFDMNFNRFYKWFHSHSTSSGLRHFWAFL